VQVRGRVGAGGELVEGVEEVEKVASKQVCVGLAAVVTAVVVVVAAAGSWFSKA
jgi:hypothetical protein